MEINRADIADAQEILALQKLAYQSEAALYNDYTIQPLLQNIHSMQEDIQDKVVLKTIDKNKIVGSIRAYEKDGTCYIGKLIVHPDYQNQGLGTRLLREIEKYFPQANRFELYTGYRSNKNLHIYQAKFGYQIFKTEKINELLTLVYLERRRLNG